VYQKVIAIANTTFFVFKLKKTHPNPIWMPGIPPYIDEYIPLAGIFSFQYIL